MNEPKTDSRKVFRQPLNYESGVILPKIRDISLWRDTDIKLYESGVITLALLLPKELRSLALDFVKDNTIKEDLTGDGKKDFDNMFVYIMILLEDNNLVLPSITFDLGHD